MSRSIACLGLAIGAGFTTMAIVSCIVVVIVLRLMQRIVHVNTYKRLEVKFLHRKETLPNSVRYSPRRMYTFWIRTSMQKPSRMVAICIRMFIRSRFPARQVIRKSLKNCRSIGTSVLSERGMFESTIRFFG